MTLSEREIFGGLAEILNEAAGLPLKTIGYNTRLTGNLEVTESTLEAVTEHIRGRFTVELPAQDAHMFETVGDAVAYIQAAQA